MEEVERVPRGTAAEQAVIVENEEQLPNLTPSSECDIIVFMNYRKPKFERLDDNPTAEDFAVREAILNSEMLSSPVSIAGEIRAKLVSKAIKDKSRLVPTLVLTAKGDGE